MNTATQMQHGPADLLRMMGSPDVAMNLYTKARTQGMSLSALLEGEDPSDRYKGEAEEGLDAFSRLLKAANIRVNGDRRAGYQPSRWEEFMEHPQARALIPEWADRVCERVSYPLAYAQRELLTSQDEPLNTALRPYQVAGAPRMDQIAASIPLETVISRQTTIDGQDYKAIYMVEPAASKVRLVRVAEGAEIPRVRLVQSERSITLYKYARALEYTYEQIRRRTIDTVAFWLSRLQVQQEVDKLAAVLDVMINGDGNSGTQATNYNLTTLDSTTTAGNLTLRAWLSFKAKFNNPYMLTTILTQEPGYLALALLNSNSANIPLQVIAGPLGFGGLRPINNQFGDTVGYGITTDAPANVLVAFDGRFAIEQVMERGSQIQETERFVMRQTQAITRSENEGYFKWDLNAVKTLTLNA